MASLNRVTLIGNLGKDPEIRYTRNQIPFARFSLATTEEFTVQGEKQKKTEWHNIVVWGKQAEIVEKYLKKGKQIYLEGRIEYREWEGQDGNKRYMTDIRVDRFLMLGRAGDFNGGGGNYGGGGGGSYGGGGNQQGGGYRQGGYGGGAPQAEPQPMSYGPSGGGADDYPPPQSDDFSDDDIPF